MLPISTTHILRKHYGNHRSLLVLCFSPDRSLSRSTVARYVALPVSRFSIA